MPRKAGPLSKRDDGTWNAVIPEFTVRLHVREGRVVYVETASGGVDLRGWPFAWMAKDEVSFRWARAAISVGLRGRPPAGLFNLRRLDPPTQPKSPKTGKPMTLRKPRNVRTTERPHIFYSNRATDPLKPPPLGFTEDTLIGGTPPEDP